MKKCRVALVVAIFKINLGFITHFVNAVNCKYCTGNTVVEVSTVTPNLTNLTNTFFSFVKKALSYSSSSSSSSIHITCTTDDKFSYICIIFSGNKSVQANKQEVLYGLSVGM